MFKCTRVLQLFMLFFHVENHTCFRTIGTFFAGINCKWPLIIYTGNATLLITERSSAIKYNNIGNTNNHMRF